MEFLSKGRLRRAFALAATALFSACGAPLLAPSSSSSLPSPRDDNFANFIPAVAHDSREGFNIISAADALDCARTGKMPEGASVDLKKIIYLVGEAQKIPLGREMTRLAAEKGVRYAAQDNLPGAAAYNRILNVLKIEFRETRAGHGQPYDSGGMVDFQRNIQAFQLMFYHELGHFYQDEVWGNIKPPAGLCSYDHGLWELCTEAQADSVAHEAMFQHTQGSDAALDPARLFKAFSYDIHHGSTFHRKFYNLTKARIDDGARVNIDDFVDGFGRRMARPGNFMEARIKKPADLQFIFGSPAVKPQ